MSDLLCSAAEPPALIKLTNATIDSDCESLWGADFMSVTPYGFLLIQRKRFPDDFMASYRSGDRLDKEIKQLEGGVWKYLILELQEELHGHIPWNTNGELIGKYKGRGGISRVELDSFIESIAHFHKIHTRWTNSLTETADTILRIHKWCNKESHSGVVPKRATPNREEIARMKGDWRSWILSGFPGMGVGIAKNILKMCDEPLIWNPELSLEGVEKIGKLKAQQFRNALKPVDKG